MNAMTAAQTPVAEYGLLNEGAEADALEPSELQMVGFGQATLNNI